MHKTTHTITKKGITYIQNCIVSATHVNKKYISIRRNYGTKRTQAEAEDLVTAWEMKHQKRNNKHART